MAPSSVSYKISPPPTRSLTDLPSEIIDGILSRLPIADAVKTSVLSRSWRRRWQSIPDLVFDNIDSNNSIHDVAAALNHVLRHHSAPIRSLSLSLDLPSISSRRRIIDVDRWGLASSIRVQPVTAFLDCFRFSHTVIVPMIFSIGNLTHLRLRGLTTYGNNFWTKTEHLGFPLLETLDLDYSLFCSGRILSDLVSNCPLLQNLSLTDMEVGGRGYLRICAPNLRSLVFAGCCAGIVLVYAPLLKTASIGLEPKRIEESSSSAAAVDDEKDSMLNAIAQARGIEKLELLKDTLHFLGEFRIPKTLPGSLERLKVLSLAVDFDQVEEILALLCLLRSSPNLEELVVMVIKIGYLQGGDGMDHEFLEELDHFEWCKLHSLKLTGVGCGIRSAWSTLNFVDYILQRSPGLKTMLISFNSVCTEWSGGHCELKFKELMEYWRNSTRAEITYTDADIDMREDHRPEVEVDPEAYQDFDELPGF